jgi:AsmA-like C-terminal region
VIRRLLVILVLLVALGAATVYFLFNSDAIRRALEQQGSSWLGQPVRISRASAQLFPRLAVHLTNVQVGEPIRLTLADVRISTDFRELLSRRVQDGEIIISNSRVDLPLPFAMPPSSQSPQPTAQPASQNAGTGGGFHIVSVRTISLRDVRVVSRRREIVISADSSLAGDRLNVTRFSAASGATSIIAHGTVQLSPRLDANLDAQANKLDVDDLLALVAAFEQRDTARRGGAALPGRVRARVKAPVGTAAGVNVRNFSAAIDANGNRIALQPTSFELFGGRCDAGFTVDVGETLGTSFSARLTNIDLAQLAAFGGLPETISGRMSGDARVGGRGRDLSDVLAGARGEGRARLVNGTIRGLDLVRTVIVFFGRPSQEAPPSSGERFDEISSTFSLARQVVSTDDLKLRSPDFDLLARGTLTLPTKALDLRGDLMLSEAMSKKAGTDLYRYTHEGNRIVLPAIVGGTLASPKASIDAEAALKRGLRNEMQRRLKGLLDRLKPPSQ